MHPIGGLDSAASSADAPAPVVILAGNPIRGRIKAVVVWNAVLQVEVELPTLPSEDDAVRQQRALEHAIAKAEEFIASAKLSRG